MKKLKKKGPKIVARNRIEAIMGYRQKEIPLDDEMLLQLNEQREAFRKKFGRDPGPGDPLFFDPECDTPTPLMVEKIEEEFLKAADKAGVAREKVKAFLDALDSEVSEEHVRRRPGRGF